MKILTGAAIGLMCATACHAFNSYTGYAGSPVSYGDCAFSCHGPANSFTPTAEGWPSMYVPDSTYTIILSHNGNTISNFNACVLRQSDSIPAGVLQGDSNTVTYTHSGEGTAIHGSVNYQSAYVFTWTAPSQGTGTVVLYGAVHEGSTYGPNGVCAYSSGESGIEECRRVRMGDCMLTILNSNPVQSTVKLALSTEKGNDVKVSIHDATGKMVALLLEGWVDPGRHIVIWKPVVSSGVYFVVAGNGIQRTVEKVILMQ